MTRKKVKLAYITNDSARKATFKKRKTGLIKKVRELATLCDVEACAIIYSPYDPQPEVWPSALGVQCVFAHFRTMPEIEQRKKMVNQESFLRQRIEKSNEQLKKQRKDNQEKEIMRVMFQCLTGKSLGLSMVDLNDLRWLIDQTLKEIYSRMKRVNEEAHNQVQAPLTMAAAAPVRGVLRSGENNNMQAMMEKQVAMERQTAEINHMEAMQRPQWFMECENPTQEHMGFAGPSGVDMILPFGDQNLNAFWPNNGYFP